MNSIADFCRAHGLCLTRQDLERGKDAFLKEIAGGLTAKSSLKTLPAYIDPYGEPDYSQKVVVIDAGGTNLRVALVAFGGSVNPEVLYFENYPMLGTQGEIPVEEFFDRLAEYLLPVVGEASRIGICFSFPADILPNHDARVIELTKEVKVAGIEGKLVGEGLRAALKARGVSGEKQVVVINDTVAALLGGVAGSGGRVFDGYAGLILGTGNNSCYIERASKVSKDPVLAASQGHDIINLESGNFSEAPRSDIDIAFDRTTDIPGAQTFEKMISGAYQGSLFRRYLTAAAEEGCFTPGFRQRLEGVAKLSGKDIDLFVAYPYGGGTLAALAGDGEEDRAALYTLCDAFFDRIAVLVTMNLSALLVQMDRGRVPYRPVCIAAEGTTFYKAKLFRPKLDYYMRTFATDTLGYYYEFTKTENSTILGTATAGLLG